MSINMTYDLGDFIAAIKSPDCNNASNKARRKQWVGEQMGRAEWHGLEKDGRDGETASGAVLRLITEGWTRGVDLMQQVSADINVPTPRSVRRRQTWSDQGDEVEMQRVWSGNIENAWRKMRRADGRGPRRIRILVDSIANAGVDAEKMRWRGVAAMRLADALISAGYIVQVESGFAASSETRYRLRVIVKRYTDPLDLSSLAATTALPAFFRALGHEWHFIAAKERGVSAGYYVEDIQPEDFGDEDEDATLLVAHQKIKSAEDASTWVTECIKGLDAEVEAELEAA